MQGIVVEIPCRVITHLTRMEGIFFVLYHSFLISSLPFLFTTVDNILFTIFEGSKM